MPDEEEKNPYMLDGSYEDTMRNLRELLELKEGQTFNDVDWKALLGDDYDEDEYELTSEDIKGILKLVIAHADVARKLAFLSQTDNMFDQGMAEAYCEVLRVIQKRLQEKGIDLETFDLYFDTEAEIEALKEKNKNQS